jgi:hypothetical protein
VNAVLPYSKKLKYKVERITKSSPHTVQQLEVREWPWPAEKLPDCSNVETRGCMKVKIKFLPDKEINIVGLRYSVRKVKMSFQ